MAPLPGKSSPIPITAERTAIGWIGPRSPALLPRMGRLRSESLRAQARVASPPPATMGESDSIPLRKAIRAARCVNRSKPPLMAANYLLRAPFRPISPTKRGVASSPSVTKTPPEWTSSCWVPPASREEQRFATPSRPIPRESPTAISVSWTGAGMERGSSRGGCITMERGDRS